MAGVDGGLIKGLLGGAEEALVGVQEEFGMGGTAGGVAEGPGLVEGREIGLSGVSGEALTVEGLNLNAGAAEQEIEELGGFGFDGAGTAFEGRDEGGGEGLEGLHFGGREELGPAFGDGIGGGEGQSGFLREATLGQGPESE